MRRENSREGKEIRDIWNEKCVWCEILNTCMCQSTASPEMYYMYIRVLDSSK